MRTVLARVYDFERSGNYKSRSRWEGKCRGKNISDGEFDQMRLLRLDVVRRNNHKVVVVWICWATFGVEATGTAVPRTRALLPLLTTWSPNVSQTISTGVSPFCILRPASQYDDWYSLPEFQWNVTLVHHGNRNKRSMSIEIVTKHREAVAWMENLTWKCLHTYRNESTGS